MRTLCVLFLCVATILLANFMVMAVFAGSSTGMFWYGVGTVISGVALKISVE